MSTTIEELRQVQRELDRATWRAIRRRVVGDMTQADLDDLLVLNARLWTRAENEIAGLQGRPVYQEDNVAPTVF